MLEDWTVDLAAGTAAHIPTGLVLELVKDHASWPLMRVRPATTAGVVAVQVERLLREGTIAYREARGGG